MMENIWISLIGEGGRLLMAPNGLNSMRALVESINQNFHRYSSSKTAVVGFFGNNGNFVLNSRITNVSEITDFFVHALVTMQFCLIYLIFNWLIQSICSISD
jgi:hypothetical protein